MTVLRTISQGALFWAACSQFPGCESVNWGLIEEVVMATWLR